MKYISLLFTLSAFITFSQVETTTWNGKTYYVYPHQHDEQMRIMEVLMREYADFREVLKRDEKNRKVISTEVVPIEKEEHDMYDDLYKESRKMARQRKEQEKLLVVILHKKPELFYEYTGITSNDVTPALEAIPDGDYIQYYRDLPYLDGKTIRFRNDVVAGTFTVKNNQINGLATWYTADGRIVKTGTYVDGAREGVWKTFQYQPSAEQPEDENIDPKDGEAVIDYLLTHDLVCDTMSESYTFTGGLKNGAYNRMFNQRVLTSGAYKNDRESGTWDHYDFKISMTSDPENPFAHSDTLILVKHYTLADKPQRRKSVIIRDEVVASDFLYDYYPEELEFEDEYMPRMRDTSLVLDNKLAYEPFEDFSEFYTIPVEETEEEGLELPEEGINSYEGEEYEDEFYGEPYYDEDYSYGSGDRYLNGKYYSTNELIDSIGYEFRYEGVYESYYQNGQLKMRFEVRDGLLVEEDTIFWDNGKAANTVYFDTDSNQYVQHFFDYNGKLYQTLLFDAKGEPLNEEAVEESNAVVIDGLTYYPNREDQVLEYTRDMETVLTERELVKIHRWAADSAIAMTAYLDPVTRVHDFTNYTVQNDRFFTEQATFGEEYKNVNATGNMQIGPLRCESIKSGSLYDFSGDSYYSGMFGDSMNPQAYAVNWYRYYEIQSDEVLYWNDQPFTGKLEIVSDASKYRLSAGETAIRVQLPTAAKEEKLLEKALKKYYKRGKHAAILELCNEYAVSYARPVSTLLGLFPGVNSVFTIHRQSYDRYDDYEDYAFDYETGERPKKHKPNKKMERPYDKTVSGSYLNGKPEGEWIVKDQFGQVTTRVFFTKGERDGKATYYATEYPLSEEIQEMRELMADETDPMLYDDLPAEKTYYVSSTENYRNGLLNGPAVEYDWKGDTTSFSTYRDGLAEGTSFQRSKLFYTVAGYEYGDLDGISRTYLTLPNRDSILIFDLNFQNGALQGESKAYHTNGKLAKRGFFLGGQPIDDYEAFDTLGFKYQYVKFQFNQPVEEKIWEENQLSVRYLFNWQDSIPFDIRDIAGSSSFERLASDLGLIRDPYSAPYYGRPSLVDKTGIDYSITKYYPNDTIAREGKISKGKKVGHWRYFSYEGKPLYEVDYQDSIITVNDSIRFKSKGILTYVDEKHQPVSRSYIIEKVEKYDCAHTDHNEERMLYTFWERDTSVHRINGYMKNYYDNGAIQNEGVVENGLPTGVWKHYDSNGNLNQVGTYKQGKRDGRWLSGDLGNVKNMTEICLNPNLENLEEIMAYQEKLLDVSVIYYGMGSVLKREYYGINMNSGDVPENYDSGYYDEDEYYYGE